MNLVRKLGLILAALLLIVAVSSPVFAQPDKKTDTAKVEKQQPQSFGSPAWGAGLGAGLVLIGAGLGFGKIGAAALESMARQPQTAGQVQTAMIIIGALLEGATFFALVICILLSLAV